MSNQSAPAPDRETPSLDEAQRVCDELKAQVAHVKLRFQEAYRELESRTQSASEA